MSTLLAVLAAILGLVAIAAVYMAVRAAALLGHPSSFGAWIIDAGSSRWIRGIALYGQVHLAWYELGSASLRPSVRLPRTRLEVVGAPVRSRDGNYTLVRLRAPEHEYTFALIPGDAAGLISWVNSAPPGITMR